MEVSVSCWLTTVVLRLLQTALLVGNSQDGNRIFSHLLFPFKMIGWPIKWLVGWRIGELRQQYWLALPPFPVL
jgi:hypothetical protein